MTNRVGWPLHAGIDIAVPLLADWLKARGYQVNATRKNYRAIMFRRDSAKWTQGHFRLTKIHKIPQDAIRLSGPEENAVPTDIFYIDGELNNKLHGAIVRQNNE